MKPEHFKIVARGRSGGASFIQVEGSREQLEELARNLIVYAATGNALDTVHVYTDEGLTFEFAKEVVASDEDPQPTQGAPY